MASSSAALLFSIGALGVYGYSFYFLFFKADFTKIPGFVPEALRLYGQWKFLTIHCLVFQIINSVLHILAHFVRPLEKARDAFFFAMAYPIGSVVVYSFWAVWFILGRELVYPSKLDQVNPSYINHFIHTIIVPINMLLLFTVHHRPRKMAAILCVVYLLSYTALLQHFKSKTGYSVYGFLDTMNETQRYVYYFGTTVLGFVLYKSGIVLSNLIHARQASPVVQKKQKQKHK